MIVSPCLILRDAFRIRWTRVLLKKIYAGTVLLFTVSIKVYLTRSNCIRQKNQLI